MTTTAPPAALRAAGLGKRYRRGWALADCTFDLPAGRVAALVGPNGAGKTTLMMLAASVLRPTRGEVRVFGVRADRRETGPRVSLLAQERPLYPGFTVAETLRLGRELNPFWDQRYAERLVREADLPLTARVGTLSGGQQSRVALALALGRRPELVLLDEPLADLDPLARQQVMQTLMAEVAETGMTVVLSSHVLADLEGVCDFLLLLGEGRVRLAGDVEALLGAHAVLTGPGDLPAAGGAGPYTVVESRTTGRQTTALVHAPGLSGPAGWQVDSPTLEELVIAYLRSAAAPGVSVGDQVPA